MSRSEPVPPLPVRFTGSRLARWLLRRLGWQVHFDGLPSLQGLLLVYPHTSNWDFWVLVLAKWAIGLPARFWAKDSLFRIPLFGRWLSWLGGVPVDRASPRGVVAQAVSQFVRARDEGRYFWLALAPEGTRKLMPGWRSGFYRTALQADVPLALVRLDFRLRRISVTDFLHLSGDEARDMQCIAQAYAGVTGCKPAHAAPIRLLDASVPRTETRVN